MKLEQERAMFSDYPKKLTRLEISAQLYYHYKNNIKTFYKMHFVRE